MSSIIFYILFFSALYAGLFLLKKFVNEKIIKDEDLEDDVSLS